MMIYIKGTSLEVSHNEEYRTIGGKCESLYPYLSLKNYMHEKSIYFI